jgi:hypothetical protein
MKQHQILPFYRNLCAGIGISPGVGEKTECSPEAQVPHPLLRRSLQNDPAMSAILEGGGIHFALGSFDDAPFIFLEPGLIQLSSALIFDPAALSVAARWGLEAHRMRRTSELGPRQLAGLVRHGNALIEQLSESSRERLLSLIPPSIRAELAAEDSLVRPGEDLLSWIAGLTRSAKQHGHARRGYDITELDYPVERILASGGDSRLLIDPSTGCNKYGVPPRPRPEAVHFSSSTASAITDYGFLLCDLLRRDLLSAIEAGAVSEKDLRSRLVEAVGREILDLFALDRTASDLAIAPSGTDTELLALLIARSGAQGRPLVNVLIAPDESGTGVPLAARGCRFDDIAATGCHAARGTAVWPDASITVKEIPIRDRHGEALATHQVNATFLEVCRAALREGNHLLVHVLMSSKTDLYAPDFDAVAELLREAPERVDVVVDACQLRASPGALGDLVRQGWMVQVSGSKFLTGPPFSGALLVPAALRRRAPAILEGLLQSPEVGSPLDWLAGWNSPLSASVGFTSYGPLFRWLPPLLEAKLFFALPEDFRLEVMSRFREALLEYMYRSEYLRPLKLVDPCTTERGDAMAQHSILSFAVLGRRQDGELTPLSETECKRLFELLNRDVASLLPPLSPREEALARQPVHIGQPVTLGASDPAITVLRLVLGARFFTIVGHAEPESRAAALESEIADAERAIAKVGLLASYWWRLA